MATLRLKDSYAETGNRFEPTHLMVRNGVEGMIRVTKAETVEVSALVASRYLGSKNIETLFTESDREGLLSLPDREVDVLMKVLRCNKENIVSMLLPEKPKPTVPEKLRASVKKATTKKPAAKKPAAKKTAKKETKPVLEEE